MAEEKKESTQDSEKKGTEEITAKPDLTEGDKKSEEGEGDKDKKSEEPVIDYKAEAEKLQTKLSQAEFLLKKKNIDGKKGKKDAEEGDDDEDEDLDGDGKKETPTIDKQLEDFKLSQLQDVITDELLKISNDPDEQVLIKLHFENTIKRSGDSRAAIADDLKTARLIANKPRFEKLAGEIAAKKKSDANKGGGESGGHDIEGDAPANTEGLSGADKQFMDKFGIKPEEIKS